MFSYLTLLLFVLPDMTFTHEGNKTFIDNLVNFEKMVRILKVPVGALKDALFNCISMTADFCYTHSSLFFFFFPANDSQHCEDTEIL